MSYGPQTLHLLQRIEEYKALVRDLLQSQIGFAAVPLAGLNLQVIEDKFELIEGDASDLQILPKLDDMTVEDFLDHP